MQLTYTFLAPVEFQMGIVPPSPITGLGFVNPAAIVGGTGGEKFAVAVVVTGSSSEFLAVQVQVTGPAVGELSVMPDGLP